MVRGVQACVCMCMCVRMCVTGVSQVGKLEEARDYNDGGVCEPIRESGRDSRVIRSMGVIRGRSEKEPLVSRSSEG